MSGPLDIRRLRNLQAGLAPHGNEPGRSEAGLECGADRIRTTYLNGHCAPESLFTFGTAARLLTARRLPTSTSTNS